MIKKETVQNNFIEADQDIDDILREIESESNAA